ncbi:MAG: hypothetical protein ABFC89_00795 [Methanospirillum sp.]
MVSRQQRDRIRRGVRLAVLALLLSFLIGSAIAAPIPSEQRATLFSPSFSNLNATSPDQFTTVKTYDTSYLGRKDIPQIYTRNGTIFPDLAQYEHQETLLYQRTGETYFVEIWYFDEWSVYVEKRETLSRFFAQNGTFTPVTIDTTVELAGTDNAGLAQQRGGRCTATKYIGNETSGYLVSTSGHGGYFIVYYGVAGRSDLVREDYPLKLLMLSSIADPVTSGRYAIDPAGPTSLPLSPLFYQPVLQIEYFAVILVMALVFAVFTTGLYILVEVATVPSVRAFVPPVLAVLLNTVHFALPGHIPYMVAAMAVMTPLPLFAGNLKIISERTAVFLCGLGALPLMLVTSHLFFGVTEGLLLNLPLAWTPTIWFYELSSLLGIFVPGAVFAAGVYVLILLSDRHWTRRRGRVRRDGKV